LPSLKDLDVVWTNVSDQAAAELERTVAGLKVSR
jgi:hypothetical protein